MKFKCILALFLLLSGSLFSYSYISPLFDTEATYRRENKGGLFVSQAVSGSYNPFTFNVNTKIYYRIVLFDINTNMNSVTNTNAITTNVAATNTNTNTSGIIPMAPEGEFVVINTNDTMPLDATNVATNTNMIIRFKNYSLRNTRLDIGIENNFSQANDRLGVFLYFEPISFFSVGLGAYATFWYSRLKFGYLGFESLDNIKYSSTEIKNNDARTSKRGFLVKLTPSLHFNLGSFIIQNTSTITYEVVGDKPYYLNNRTFLPHKKSGIDINNDTYLLGNTYPIFIGLYYGFTYIQSYSKLEHRFGVAAMTHYSFLKNKLFLDVGAASGINLTLENYQNSTFIEVKASVSYIIL